MSLLALDHLFASWHYSFRNESSYTMKITIGLSPGQRRWRDASNAIPELKVILHDAQPWIEIDGDRRPLWVLERASALPQNLRAAVPPGAIGLVVGIVPGNERRELEKDGLAWWDLRGSLHIAYGTKFVHIERGTVPKPIGNDVVGRKLGPVGTRAVQTMLSVHSDRDWTVSGLAAEAGVSLGQAHSVLTLLEQRGYLRTKGKGAHKRRLMTDRVGCLNWLGELESSKRQPAGVWTYLYARNDHERMRRFDELAARIDVRYAITSAYAATLLGAPVTTRPVVIYVRVKGRAEDVRRELGLDYLDADEAARGANLVLWTDTGEVGTYNAGLIDGLRVAPAVRVWLDLVRQGGRERDGAELLREALLDQP